jgi:hypothetical protein
MKQTLLRNCEVADFVEMLASGFAYYFMPVTLKV